MSPDDLPSRRQRARLTKVKRPPASLRNTPSGSRLTSAWKPVSRSRTTRVLPDPSSATLSGTDAKPAWLLAAIRLRGPDPPSRASVGRLYNPDVIAPEPKVI